MQYIFHITLLISKHSKSIDSVLAQTRISLKLRFFWSEKSERCYVPRLFRLCSGGKLKSKKISGGKYKSKTISGGKLKWRKISGGGNSESCEDSSGQSFQSIGSNTLGLNKNICSWFCIITRIPSVMKKHRPINCIHCFHCLHRLHCFHSLYSGYKFPIPMRLERLKNMVASLKHLQC